MAVVLPGAVNRTNSGDAVTVTVGAEARLDLTDASCAKLTLITDTNTAMQLVNRVKLLIGVLLGISCPPESFRVYFTICLDRLPTSCHPTQTSPGCAPYSRGDHRRNPAACRFLFRASAR